MLRGSAGLLVSRPRANEGQKGFKNFCKAGLIGTQILPPSASFQKVGLPSCRHLPSLFYKYIVKSVADTFRTCFRFKEKNMLL